MPLLFLMIIASGWDRYGHRQTLSRNSIWKRHRDTSQAQSSVKALVHEKKSLHACFSISSFGCHDLISIVYIYIVRLLVILERNSDKLCAHGFADQYLYTYPHIYILEWTCRYTATARCGSDRRFIKSRSGPCQQALS